MTEIVTIKENVDLITIGGRQFYIIGTAHVSHSSADLAEEMVRSVNPDSVAIELCEARYTALSDPNRWQNTDIVQVIRSGRSHLLLAQLMLAAFQRKLGKEINIRPGAEMMRAASVADELGKSIVLADRDVKTTLKRTWAALTWWQKMKLAFSFPLKLFSDEKINPEEIERLKKSDALAEAMHELSVAFPGIRGALIDERDKYLAAKIFASPGQNVVAIVGAGHVPGIKSYLGQDLDLTALEIIPKAGVLGKVIAWSIPVLFVGLLLYGLMDQGVETTVAMAESWILITGISAALGAIVTLAHPLTILTAFVTAPFTTLHPLLASGWFAGLVEALLRKPKVSDLESILDDILSLKGLWRNRLSRILLVVAITNLFGTIGAMIAMGKVAFLSSLFTSSP